MKGEIYRQRFTTCGKANCRKCRDGGPGHGPYWYAYRMVNGQTVQRYVGKSLPPEVLPAVGRHHEQMLVGRTNEIERLRFIFTDIERIKRGEQPRMTVPQCVLLTGEIGIGKTRVLEEVAREAQTREWHVVWERSVVQEQHLPYNMWSDVFRKVLLTSTAQREIEHHPDLYRPLNALLPVMLPSQAEPAASLPAEQEQLRLWEAARELLTNVAEGMPLLIVLDDLHWSDSSSCELLAYLVRRLSGHPLIILGTCRDKEVPENHALRPLLTDQQREGAVEMILLEPLSKEQIATLVAQVAPSAHHVSELLIERIQERAAGNPFFAEELVRGVDLQQSDATLLPASIAAVLDLRLSHLSKACHRLLSKAAVLGGSFEFSLIQAMESTSTNEADEDAILTLLEEGLKSGLLTEEGVGTHITYFFWHPLLVSHLYEGLSAVRRANLHRRAADILRHRYRDREDEGAAIITHHLILGGDDPQHIIHFAERAGDRAYRLSAYPEAERQYTIAVESMMAQNKEMVQSHDRQHLISLLMRVAECVSVQGKTERARHLYERVLAVWVPLDDQVVNAQLLALLWAEIGWTWRYSAETAKALRCCEQGEQILHQVGIVDGPAWATLFYQRGSIAWQEGNYQEALQHAQTSLMLFEQFLDDTKKERPSAGTRMQRTLDGDPVDPGRLHLLLAALFATVGQSKETEEHLHIALSTFERYDCQREMATVCCNLGDMYMRQAKYSLAQTILERAIAITERIGDRPNLTVALANAGILALRQYDVVGAEVLVSRALTLAEQIDDPIYRSLLHSYLSIAQQECGMLQEAKASLCAALKIGRAIHSTPCIAFALVTLAQYRFSTAENETYQVQHARRTVDRALSMQEIEAETRVEGYLILAQILFSLGEKPHAVQVAQQALQQATHDELLWLVSRAQDALQHFNEALSHHKVVG